MPMTMLKLVPGVNVEVTASQLEAGYASSNFGRFRSGLFEKLGGWAKYFEFAVGGIPRALNAWQDRNEVNYLGVGTTTNLSIVSNGVITDLTPQTYTSNFAPKFSTTIGSPNVTVDDSNIANVTTLDSVYFPVPVSVGGIILSGSYPIDVILGTTQYRIVAGANATSSVTDGGAVPSFATTSGSSSISVTLANHGLAAFDQFVAPVATSVGGLTIQGAYSVVSVTSSSVFVIAASSLATSTTSASMNSGLARIIYYITIGPVAATSGYSVGPYSAGGYSTGSSSGSQQTGTPIAATDWTLDNWGEILLACPSGGGIYSWQPNSGINNAGLVAGAPLLNSGMFVSMQTQMLICYGSTSESGIGLDQNPLLVAWSDIGDFSAFTPSITSQAGSRVLPTGSKIVTGMSSPQQELIWTDLDLWSMNYLGSLAAGVWGFTKIGASCGAIARHAAVSQGGNVYWMGISNFFVLGAGAPQAIPCSVWDVVFQDLNTDYQSKCFAWSNTPFNEVWFFFPRLSTGATECDCFVKVNTLTGLWDYTPLSRSCGIDQSLLGMPISATPSGLIYEHEVSPDADGQPINSYFVTGWFPISDGQDIVFCDWLLPDMKWGNFGGAQTANILITLESVYYPGETAQVYGPYSVLQSTPYINPRLRGRLGRFRIESNDIGSFWRVGGIRYRVAPDGRLP